MKKILLILLIIILLFFTVYKVFNVEERILSYFYPKKYSEYVYKYSEELDIDPLLVFSVIKTESNFNEKIVSRSGAVGLMQLMEETAKEQAKKLNISYNEDILYKSDINIKLGVNYFSSLLKSFNNNYILAFAAYNAGIGNVQKWISNGIIKNDGSDFENIPFKETNMYVRKIIRNYKIYKYLYK